MALDCFCVKLSVIAASYAACRLAAAAVVAAAAASEVASAASVSDCAQPCVHGVKGTLAGRGSEDTCGLYCDRCMLSSVCATAQV